jgi:hypothetical protein
MIAAGVLEREMEGAYRSTTTRLHFHNSPLSAKRKQMQDEEQAQASRIERKKELQARTQAQLRAVRRCLLKNRNTHEESSSSSRLPFPLVVLLKSNKGRVSL